MSALVNKNYKNKIHKLESVLKDLSETVRITGNKTLFETIDDYGEESEEIICWRYF